MRKHIFFLMMSCSLLTLLFASQSCNENAGAESADHKSASNENSGVTPYLLSEEFKYYWYNGKAEVSSYLLQQARYGEIHEGSAVLIFVTEDISAARQVKLDHPEAAGADKIPVLKMNMIKKFVTGIYSYSMMLSCFKPVDINTYPHSLKSVATVEDWCGTTYSQLNLRNGKNEIGIHSYFENEVDQNLSFKTTWLEDELWNLIRIAPDRLPAGDHQILPGFFFSRLVHIPLDPQQAKLSLLTNGNEMNYTIYVPSQQHTIIIHFEKKFPHKILKWEETFPGFDGKMLTTTATLNKTMITDYWVHHNNADRVMREELGLPRDTQ